MNVLVKFRQALALAAAVVATACAFAAQAQPRDSWPSKPIRDEGWKKMMEDPRMKDHQMPFDGKRMIYGGFSPILDI